MESPGADHLPFSSTTLPRMQEHRWVAHSRKHKERGQETDPSTCRGLKETSQLPLPLGTERNAVEQFSWEVSLGWESRGTGHEPDSSCEFKSLRG